MKRKIYYILLNFAATHSNNQLLKPGLTKPGKGIKVLLLIIAQRLIKQNMEWWGLSTCTAQNTFNSNADLDADPGSKLKYYGWMDANIFMIY